MPTEDEPTENEPTENEMAQYQAALLEILDSGATPEQMLDTMKRHPHLATFRDYVGSFDLSMVETAAELIKKWGHKVRPEREFEKD